MQPTQKAARLISGVLLMEKNVFNFIDFTWLEFVVFLELDHYQDHSQKIEKMLLKEVADLRKKIEKESSKLSGFEKAEHFESYGMEFHDIIDVIPKIQRRSELINIYTVLEKTIIRICQDYEKTINNPVKMKDLVSDGIINQAKIYLTKVARIVFPKNSYTWKEILFIQQIRNSFVHADGLVKSGNNPLISYVKKSKYLELKKDFKIEIKEGFTLYCISLFQIFLEELFSILKKSNTLQIHSSETGPNK